jgi:hypothetical protein
VKFYNILKKYFKEKIINYNPINEEIENLLIYYNLFYVSYDEMKLEIIRRNLFEEQQKKLIEDFNNNLKNIYKGIKIIFFKKIFIKV